MNHKSHSESRSSGRIVRLFKLAVLLTALGCLWIWRISMYEKVTTQELMLEKEGKHLLCEADILLQELLVLSEPIAIEDRAYRELYMEPLASKPDTVWLPSNSMEIRVGTMSLMGISFEE